MSRYKLIIAILSLDFIIVLLHFLFGHSSVLFNLDSEQNVPTLYQGVKLIIISTIVFTYIYQSAYVNNNLNLQPAIIWFPFYAMFLFLGVDEIGQVHENFTSLLVSSGADSVENYVSFFDRLDFSSSTWLLIYIPAFMFFIAYISILFKTILKNYRNETKFLVIGAFLFILVPLLEFLGTTDALYFSNKYESLMVLEETFEMIGATFLFFFSWRMLKKQYMQWFEQNQYSKLSNNL